MNKTHIPPCQAKEQENGDQRYKARGASEHVVGLWQDCHGRKLDVRKGAGIAGPEKDKGAVRRSVTLPQVLVMGDVRNPVSNSTLRIQP